MIVGYVDESGCLGKKNRYFVIALFVCTNPKRIKNFCRKFCRDNNLKEIKGSGLTFVQRQNLFNKLKFTNDYFISYIVCDKHKVKNKQLLLEPNLMYNYLSGFLLKKTVRGGNDDVHINYDNHTVKVDSKNSLEDYLRIKAMSEWNFSHKLHIKFLESESSYCVQMADVVANTLFRYYHHPDRYEHFYRIIDPDESIKFPQNTFGA